MTILLNVYITGVSVNCGDSNLKSIKILQDVGSGTYA